MGNAALEGLLTSRGCRVTVAGDPQTACELLKQMPTPDLIVSDYRLRGLQNGIDAARLRINHHAAIFLSEGALLRLRQDLQHRFGRPAQARAQGRHHDRAVDQDRVALLIFVTQ